MKLSPALAGRVSAPTPDRSPPCFPDSGDCLFQPDMDVLPMCSIFQELQIVHETGYFSALPSLEEYWQQVNRDFHVRRGAGKMGCARECIPLKIVVSVMEKQNKVLLPPSGHAGPLEGSFRGEERSCHCHWRGAPPRCPFPGYFYFYFYFFLRFSELLNSVHRGETRTLYLTPARARGSSLGLVPGPDATAEPRPRHELDCRGIFGLFLRDFALVRSLLGFVRAVF